MKRKLTAAFTLFVFSLSSTTWAQPPSAVRQGTPSSAPQWLSSQVTVPNELGTIQDSYKGKGNETVILIQDAHAILDAQTNIQKLIDYLQTQYGINLVALEGGKGALDPTLFRSFPEDLTKKKVLAQYLDRGELSGAEMAAIFNPTEARYYGIEDWNLYEENYLAYLRAMEVKEKLLEKLKGLKSQFDLEREKIYSPQLNEFHKHVEAFYEESSHLIELLKYLQSFQASRETLHEKYPHLATLFESLARDSSMDKEGLKIHIRKMSESFKKKFFTKLPLDKQKEFNRQYQALVTGAVDSGSFLKYLVDTAHSLGIRPKLSPVLQTLLGHVETLSTIKGTKLFDELQSFLQEIETRLTTQPEEKELAERYKKLRLLKDLSNLESTREQLEQYRANPESYTSLLGEGDKLLLPALEFYRVALERDQAFHKNLEGLLKKEKAHSVIVLAGGFHTQGFEQSLKDRGFSYAVISPKIVSLEGKEHYSEVMQGNLSYKKYLETTFYDAFTRHATLNLVNELNQPNFRKDLKLWRDEVIRKLANEGRITEASQYTRYIDLLFKAYYEKFGENQTPASKEEILKAVQKELGQFQDETVSRLWQRFQIQFKEFTQGLRELIDKQTLTKENVSSLLERASQTKPFTLVQLARPALTPGISVQSMRSELREFILNGKQPEITSATTLVPFAKPQDVVQGLLEKAKRGPAPDRGLVNTLTQTQAVRTAAQEIINTGSIVKTAFPEAKPEPVNQEAVDQLVTNVGDKVRSELRSVSPEAIALAIAKVVEERNSQVKQVNPGPVSVVTGPIEALDTTSPARAETRMDEKKRDQLIQNARLAISTAFENSNTVMVYGEPDGESNPSILENPRTGTPMPLTRDEVADRTTDARKEIGYQKGTFFFLPEVSQPQAAPVTFSPKQTVAAPTIASKPAAGPEEKKVSSTPSIDQAKREAVERAEVMIKRFSLKDTESQLVKDSAQRGITGGTFAMIGQLRSRIGIDVTVPKNNPLVFVSIAQAMKAVQAWGAVSQVPVLDSPQSTGGTFKTLAEVTVGILEGEVYSPDGSKLVSVARSETRTEQMYPIEGISSQGERWSAESLLTPADYEEYHRVSNEGFDRFDGVQANAWELEWLRQSGLSVKVESYNVSTPHKFEPVPFGQKRITRYKDLLTGKTYEVDTTNHNTFYFFPTSVETHVTVAKGREKEVARQILQWRKNMIDQFNLSHQGNQSATPLIVQQTMSTGQSQTVGITNNLDLIRTLLARGVLVYNNNQLFLAGESAQSLQERFRRSVPAQVAVASRPATVTPKLRETMTSTEWQTITWNVQKKFTSGNFDAHEGHLPDGTVITQFQYKGQFVGILNGGVSRDFVTMSEGFNTKTATTFQTAYLQTSQGNLSVRIDDPKTTVFEVNQSGARGFIQVNRSEVRMDLNGLSGLLQADDKETARFFSKLADERSWQKAKEAWWQTLDEAGKKKYDLDNVPLPTIDLPADWKKFKIEIPAINIAALFEEFKPREINQELFRQVVEDMQRRMARAWFELEEYKRVTGQTGVVSVRALADWYKKNVIPDRERSYFAEALVDYVDLSDQFFDRQATRDKNGLLPFKNIKNYSDEQLKDAISRYDAIIELWGRPEYNLVKGFSKAVFGQAQGYRDKLKAELANRSEARTTKDKETVRLAHVTSFSSFGKIMRQGFYNALNYKTFLPLSEVSYPTYGEDTKIQIVFNAPKDLVKQDTKFLSSDPDVFMLSEKSALTNPAQLTKAKEVLGEEGLQVLLKLGKGQIGYIAPEHIDIAETIIRNKARKERGALSAEAFDRMMGFIAGLNRSEVRTDSLDFKRMLEEFVRNQPIIIPQKPINWEELKRDLDRTLREVYDRKFEIFIPTPQIDFKGYEADFSAFTAKLKDEKLVIKDFEIDKIIDRDMIRFWFEMELFKKETGFSGWVSITRLVSWLQSKIDKGEFTEENLSPFSRELMRYQRVVNEFFDRQGGKRDAQGLLLPKANIAKVEQQRVEQAIKALNKVIEELGKPKYGLVVSGFSKAGFGQAVGYRQKLQTELEGRKQKPSAGFGSSNTLPPFDFAAQLEKDRKKWDELVKEIMRQAEEQRQREFQEWLQKKVQELEASLASKRETYVPKEFKINIPPQTVSLQQPTLSQEQDAALVKVAEIDRAGYFSSGVLGVDGKVLSKEEIKAAIRDGRIVLDNADNLRFTDQARRESLPQYWYHGTNWDFIEQMIFGRKQGEAATFRFGNLTRDKGYADIHGQKGTDAQRVTLTFDFSSNPLDALDYFGNTAFFASVGIHQPVPLTRLSQENKREIVKRFANRGEDALNTLAEALVLSLEEVNTFRSEVREAPGIQNGDLRSFLPDASKIVSQIQKKGSLEVAIRTWEAEARSRLENDVRVELFVPDEISNPKLYAEGILPSSFFNEARTHLDGQAKDVNRPLGGEAFVSLFRDEFKKMERELNKFKQRSEVRISTEKKVKGGLLLIAGALGALIVAGIRHGQIPDDFEVNQPNAVQRVPQTGKQMSPQEKQRLIEQAHERLKTIAAESKSSLLKRIIELAQDFPIEASSEKFSHWNPTNRKLFIGGDTFDRIMNQRLSEKEALDAVIASLAHESTHGAVFSAKKKAAENPEGFDPRDKILASLDQSAEEVLALEVGHFVPEGTILIMTQAGDKLITFEAKLVQEKENAFYAWTFAELKGEPGNYRPEVLKLSNKEQMDFLNDVTDWPHLEEVREILQDISTQLKEKEEAASAQKRSEIRSANVNNHNNFDPNIATSGKPSDHQKLNEGVYRPALERKAIRQQRTDGKAQPDIVMPNGEKLFFWDAQDEQKIFLGHAGIRNNAGYAQNGAQMAHELAELRLWRQFAREVLGMIGNEITNLEDGGLIAIGRRAAELGISKQLLEQLYEAFHRVGQRAEDIARHRLSGQLDRYTEVEVAGMEDNARQNLAAQIDNAVREAMKSPPASSVLKLIEISKIFTQIERTAKLYRLAASYFNQEGPQSNAGQGAYQKAQQLADPIRKYVRDIQSKAIDQKLVAELTAKFDQLEQTAHQIDSSQTDQTNPKEWTTTGTATVIPDFKNVEKTTEGLIDDFRLALGNEFEDILEEFGVPRNAAPQEIIESLIGPHVEGADPLEAFLQGREQLQNLMDRIQEKLKEKYGKAEGERKFNEIQKNNESKVQTRIQKDVEVEPKINAKPLNIDQFQLPSSSSDSSKFDPNISTRGDVRNEEPDIHQLLQRIKETGKMNNFEMWDPAKGLLNAVSSNKTLDQLTDEEVEILLDGLKGGYGMFQFLIGRAALPEVLMNLLEFHSQTLSQENIQKILNALDDFFGFNGPKKADVQAKDIIEGLGGEEKLREKLERLRNSALRPNQDQVTDITEGTKIGELTVGGTVVFGDVPTQLFKEGDSLILRDLSTGRNYPLKVGLNTIGRSEGQNVVLKGRLVSRKHAVLVVSGDKITVYDLGSTHGTAIPKSEGQNGANPRSEVRAADQRALEYLESDKAFYQRNGTSVLRPDGSQKQMFYNDTLLGIKNGQIRLRADGDGLEFYEKEKVSAPSLSATPTEKSETFFQKDLSKEAKARALKEALQDLLNEKSIKRFDQMMISFREMIQRMGIEIGKVTIKGQSVEVVLEEHRQQIIASGPDKEKIKTSTARSTNPSVASPRVSASPSDNEKRAFEILTGTNVGYLVYGSVPQGLYAPKSDQNEEKLVQQQLGDAIGMRHESGWRVASVKNLVGDPRRMDALALSGTDKSSARARKIADELSRKHNRASLFAYVLPDTREIPEKVKVKKKVKVEKKGLLGLSAHQEEIEVEEEETHYKIVPKPPGDYIKGYRGKENEKVFALLLTMPDMSDEFGRRGNRYIHAFFIPESLFESIRTEIERNPLLIYKAVASKERASVLWNDHHLRQLGLAQEEMPQTPIFIGRREVAERALEEDELAKKFLEEERRKAGGSEPDSVRLGLEKAEHKLEIISNVSAELKEIYAKTRGTQQIILAVRDHFPVSRSEVRQTPIKEIGDLRFFLPNASEIISQIQEKGSLEAAVKAWEEDARKRLEDTVRERLATGIERVIAEGAEKHQKLEDFMNWLISPEFEKAVRDSLHPLIQDRVIDPIDADALVWRFRGAVTGEAILAVEKVDLELAGTIQGLDAAKITAFQARLDQAVIALKATYQGQKLTIAINYPDSEIIREVLNKFSDLIDRLEILLEKSQGLKRSEWQGFHLSTATVDPQNPGRAVTNVNKRGFGQEVSYALTNNLLPTDLLKNLNAIRAEIRKIPDQRLQKMAYQASVLLLFKLAELPKARRSELRKAEAFKSFLEQDQNLRFLANGFGIGQDGTVGLITSGFLADIAGIEQVKRAA